MMFCIVCDSIAFLSKQALFFFKDRWAKEGTTVNVGDVDDSRVWKSVGW